MSEIQESKIEPRWYSFDYIVAQGLVDSLKRTKPFAKGRLLDVGCGCKPYEPLYSAVNQHIGVDVPIDLSANKEPKRADVYADISKGLPFKSNCFDTVLCTEVLEHIAEPLALMNEMGRVLKPGGHLLLTAPQVWGLHEEPFDFYRYTRYGLAHLAHKSRLEVVYISARGGHWAMVGQRTSSFLHYTYAHGRSLFVKFMIRPLCIAALWCGLILDCLSKHKGDTLGNTMVARKA
jgi:SAM-dependent methyltransferase